MAKPEYSQLSANYPDFNNSIISLLEEGGGDPSILTPAAKDLLEGDLVALAWHNNTERTEKLSVRDIYSIEEAFRTHGFYGSPDEPLATACCCCTPACCCCAAALVDTVS
uniref:Putative cyclodehydratase n=1 Tax=Prochloron didemni P1-Palau TaxID=910450 RepID=G0XS61_PRODI|nr:putative cyclodehydratase [Prochloron didemni P1-Palau]